jgi:cytochrome c oxidase subunit 2
MFLHINCENESIADFIHVAYDWQLGFQTPSTSVMEGIIYFHDDLFVFLALILCFVFYIFGVCLSLFSQNKMKGVSIKLVHASTLEII